MKPRSFYFFFAFDVIAAACCVFFCPETKGRTLDQIDEPFGDQLVPRALHDPEGAEADMVEKFPDASTHVDRLE